MLIDIFQYLYVLFILRIIFWAIDWLRIMTDARKKETFQLSYLRFPWPSSDRQRSLQIEDKTWRLRMVSEKKRVRQNLKHNPTIYDECQTQ